MKNTFYRYYPVTLGADESGEQKGIGKDTKAYKMLFRNKTNTNNKVLSTIFLINPPLYF